MGSQDYLLAVNIKADRDASDLENGTSNNGPRLIMTQRDTSSDQTPLVGGQVVAAQSAGSDYAA